MICGFNFKQVMRLSNVKRWAIVEMSRQQTVAEHSFNVAIICDSICQRSGIDVAEVANILSWALAHDLPEVMTGDVPSSLKMFSPTTFKDLEKEMFPLWHEREVGMKSRNIHFIPKVADYIDAIQFAQRFCVDSRKDSIIIEMQIRYQEAVDRMESHYEMKNMVDKTWIGPEFI